MKRITTVVRTGVIALVFLLATRAEAIDLTSGLVSHWDFHEGSGSVLHDVVSGFDGSISGASWGNVGGKSALYFDGINDLVRVGDYDALDPVATQEITIVASINVPSLVSQNGTYYMGIAAKTAGPYRQIGSYTLNLENNSVPAGGNPGHLIWEQCYDGLHWQYTESAAAVPIDQLVQVAFTHDSADNSSFYIGGNLVGTSTAITQQFQNTTHDFLIGYTDSYSDYFYGTINDVRVYSRSLSADEIRVLGVAPEPSTLALLGIGVLTLLAYAWRRRKRVGS